MRKRSILALLIAGMMVALAACGSNTANNEDVSSTKIKIGATAVPHAEILKHIVPTLQEQGIELEIVEFTDYVLPNEQLNAKELDANFFQHAPYLDDQVATRGYKLVSVAGIHIEPIGAYSSTIKSLGELQDGAEIAIPNDPTNGGRALLLLAKHGLIELDANAGTNVTVSQIINNPKSFKFIELEAATLPRVLDEVAIAAINTNYALEAGLNPLADAIIMEDSTSPYINIVVTREDNKSDAKIEKLIEALQSESVKTFIDEKYKGAVVPTFTK